MHVGHTKEGLLLVAMLFAWSADAFAQDDAGDADRFRGRILNYRKELFMGKKMDRYLRLKADSLMQKYEGAPGAKRNPFKSVDPDMIIKPDPSFRSDMPIIRPDPDIDRGIIYRLPKPHQSWKRKKDR